MRTEVRGSLSEVELIGVEVTNGTKSVTIHTASAWSPVVWWVVGLAGTSCLPPTLVGGKQETPMCAVLSNPQDNAWLCTSMVAATTADARADVFFYVYDVIKP